MRLPRQKIMRAAAASEKYNMYYIPDDDDNNGLFQMRAELMNRQVAREKQKYRLYTHTHTHTSRTIIEILMGKSSLSLTL